MAKNRLTELPPDVAQEDEPTEATDAGWWCPRILVGQHEAQARRELADLLEREGYEVTVASDGFEVFDLLSPTLLELEAVQFDLILTESSMPGWSGLEILRGLRRSDWATPFVLLSTADPTVHDRAFHWGAFVFDHPVAVAELVDYVRCLLPPPGAVPLVPIDDLLALQDLVVDLDRTWGELEERLRRDGIIEASRPGG
jgi:DNA-binding response OmpR family regulator